MKAPSGAIVDLALYFAWKVGPDRCLVTYVMRILDAHVHF
jgi:hypothetical protein